jgi:hypothetical protein
MSASQENRKFCGWIRLAVLFSVDFVNIDFPVYGGTVIKSAGAAREMVPGCRANR